MRVHADAFPSVLRCRQNGTCKGKIKMTGIASEQYQAESVLNSNETFTVHWPRLVLNNAYGPSKKNRFQFLIKCSIRSE